MSAYDKLLNHIESSWDTLQSDQLEETASHLALPHSFIAPSMHRVEGFVFREQFYWDSYFTILGLIDKQPNVAQAMVDNLLYLFKTQGYIPNSNNKHHLGRSQPPLLSKMIRLVYAKNKDIDWLAQAHGLAKQEYNQVWLSSEHPNNRNIYKNLSRYYHSNKTHLGAEDESGWDYNTRFNDQALNFLPIDLNCLLFQYEMDFIEILKELNLSNQVEIWQSKGLERKASINELMWSEDKEFYFDYDYTSNQLSDTMSLAAYTSMFCSLASKAQAKSLVDNLQFFETGLGLTTTEKTDYPIEGKQWAAPNGWAPLHYMVITGLTNYGYDEDARRIADKWVKTVNEKFQKVGELFEKYNMVNADQSPVSAIYPDQYGFAWTNGVTYRLIKDFNL